MASPDLLDKIRDPQLDVAEMAGLTIGDPGLRAEIIRQMVGNPEIMVYYHCYTIVDEASRIRPDLFFEYWNDLVPLLGRPNSYHRDIALTVLANLTQVDANQYFLKIYGDYFQHLHDQKFMTGLCCLRNSTKIIRNQPDLTEKIIDTLFHDEKGSSYPQKQRALFRGVMIEVLDDVFSLLTHENQQQAVDFANHELHSVSPKTKQCARNFLTKYQVKDI